METNLFGELARNWGWIVLRGVAAVLFGVLAVALPGITLASLVIVWGAYALADGVLTLVAAWSVRGTGSPFWSMIITGLLGICAGVVTFLWPALTAVTLLLVIACWALFVGVLQIVLAIRLRKEIDHEWLLGASGILSVLFGALMIFSPGAGALALIGLIAGYAIAFGVMLIVLGFRLKSFTSGRPAHA